jgi:hypothetical protein
MGVSQGGNEAADTIPTSDLHFCYKQSGFHFGERLSATLGTLARENLEHCLRKRQTAINKLGCAMPKGGKDKSRFA